MFLSIYQFTNFRASKDGLVTRKFFCIHLLQFKMPHVYISGFCGGIVSAVSLTVAVIKIYIGCYCKLVDTEIESEQEILTNDIPWGWFCGSGEVLPWGGCTCCWAADTAFSCSSVIFKYSSLVYAAFSGGEPSANLNENTWNRHNSLSILRVIVVCSRNTRLIPSN